MTINKFIGLIGLLTFTLLTIYIVIIKKEKEQMQKDYETELENNKSINVLESGLLANSYALQKASWVHSIYGIDEETILTGREYSKTKLIQKLDGLTLLLSFDSNMCGPCLDREIENMKVLASTFKSLNLIVVTQGFPSNYIFNDAKFKGLESSIFTANKIPLKAGSFIDSPTFVIFKDKRPLFFYHPAKNHNRAFNMLLQVLEIAFSDK
jgi:hypothetical protein